MPTSALLMLRCVKRNLRLQQTTTFSSVRNTISMRKKNAISYPRSWMDLSVWYLLPTTPSLLISIISTDGYHEIVSFFLPIPSQSRNQNLRHQSPGSLPSSSTASRLRVVGPPESSGAPSTEPRGQAYPTDPYLRTC